MNFIKAGGWMKFKKKKAFTIVETIVYIFLSVIIFVEGISSFIPMYKTYLEVKKNSIRCNEYKDFYINLNNIISEGSIDKIVMGKDYITLCKSNYGKNMKKTIRAYENKIVVIYARGEEILTYNNMLFNVKKMEVSKKKNLIYINIYDENGDKFICCI